MTPEETEAWALQTAGQDLAVALKLLAAEAAVLMEMLEIAQSTKERSGFNRNVNDPWRKYTSPSPAPGSASGKPQNESSEG